MSVSSVAISPAAVLTILDQYSRRDQIETYTIGSLFGSVCAVAPDKTVVDVRAALPIPQRQLSNGDLGFNFHYIRQNHELVDKGRDRRALRTEATVGFYLTTHNLRVAATLYEKYSTRIANPLTLIVEPYSVPISVRAYWAGPPDASAAAAASAARDGPAPPLAASPAAFSAGAMVFREVPVVTRMAPVELAAIRALAAPRAPLVLAGLPRLRGAAGAAPTATPAMAPAPVGYLSAPQAADRAIHATSSLLVPLAAYAAAVAAGTATPSPAAARALLRLVAAVPPPPAGGARGLDAPAAAAVQDILSAQLVAKVAAAQVAIVERIHRDTLAPPPAAVVAASPAE